MLMERALALILNIVGYSSKALQIIIFIECGSKVIVVEGNLM